MAPNERQPNTEWIPNAGDASVSFLLEVDGFDRALPIVGKDMEAAGLNLHDGLPFVWRRHIG